MPVLLLIFLLTDLLAIASPIIAYYLFNQWYKYSHTINNDYAERCLYGAIALVLLFLLGRFLFRRIFSTQRKGEDEPHLTEAPKNENIKRPDGTHIHVEYYGDENKQPIIFIHGLNANCKNWYYQRKYFEKNYRLIMMDLPGMGKSTIPANKDYSLTNIASDLQAVIEHTGAYNPILWGHSLGGMTVLTFLAKYSNANKPTVKGVILQHTTYTNPVRTIIFRRLLTAIQKPVLVPLCWIIIFLSPIIWIIRWMSFLNGNAHIMSRFLTFAGTQTPAQLDYVTLLSTMTSPAVMARGCLGMFSYDVTSELANITVPALVIAANQDLLTQPDASVYMKDQLPNAELLTLIPANHQGLLERHHEVNEGAAAFIDRIK